MIFKVSDLLQKLNEISDDGMEYVDLSFMDPDEDLPAALHFDAFRSSDFDSEDYDFGYLFCKKINDIINGAS